MWFTLLQTQNVELEVWGLGFRNVGLTLLQTRALSSLPCITKTSTHDTATVEAGRHPCWAHPTQVLVAEGCALEIFSLETILLCEVDRLPSLPRQHAVRVGLTLAKIRVKLGLRVRYVEDLLAVVRVPLLVECQLVPCDCP